MAARTVHVLVGGSADWGTPVRASDELLKTWYEAYLMAKFEFEDRQVHYFKLRIVGIDEIDNDGDVPRGWGSLEFQDLDGDSLWGHVDWYRRDGLDRGTWTFASGTGKWQGTTGTVDLALFGGPQDHDAEMPPRGPIRYFGWLDGTGEIDASGAYT